MTRIVPSIQRWCESEMIEYHNPSGRERRASSHGLSVPGRDPNAHWLLANGFPDSVEFLNEIGAAIEALRPGISIVAYNKRNATMPASEQLLEIVVNARGHWRLRH